MRNILMKTFKFNSTYFILFYTIINLIQITYTELTSDEAYYWFYSLNLDWGYYDHPPVTGILTYLGGFISSSEFGVRLFHTLMMSVGMIFIFKLIPDEEKSVAGIIILALPLLNYISFILFPDTSLIGISAILIFSYHQLISKNDLKSYILFGVLLGISLLCKYHAVLILFFIVLSNLRLLRSRFFYLSLFIAFLIFLPHLIWQINNDFVTFKYHLIGRNSPFKIDYFLEYLGTQVLVIGLGLIFIPFIFKPSNQFEKSLKFISVGTFIFFALSSLKGFVHLHWTSISLVPIILIASKFYNSGKRNHLFKFMVVPFVAIVLFGRVYLMYNFLSINHTNVDYYHDRPLWGEDINKVADGLPVVFDTENSGLREAPMYAFYTGGFSLALFPGERKKSQYQILNYEDSVQSKEIMLVDNNNQGLCLETRMGKPVYYKKIKNFTSFSNINISLEYNNHISAQSPLHINAIINNHRPDSLVFSEKHKLYIEFEDHSGKIIRHDLPLNGKQVPPNSSLTIPLIFNSEFLLPGAYTFITGFSGHDISNSVNSKRVKILITKP